MHLVRARLALLVAGAIPVAALLFHCGSNTPGGSSSDASTSDQGSDAPTTDTFVPDTYVEDSTTGDDGSTADGGDDGAGDVAIDTNPPGIPCVMDEGGAPADGGDGGDSAEGAEAGDGGVGGDAGGGDAGDSGSAGDAGDAGASPGVCPGTMTCCGGWCTDLGKDPRNCGACGNACTGSQFCTGTACDNAILSNVCANSKATVALDRFPTDNEAGVSMGAALMMGCMPAVSVTSAAIDSGVAQNPVTGQPLTGPGDTLIAGGGYFGQTGVSYMENHGLSLVGGTLNGNSYLKDPKTNTTIFNVPSASLTASHDYVVIDLAVEPASGSLCLFGYGFTGQGTEAAAYYFQTNIIGNRAMFPDAWYVYEWTDTDHSGGPSPGDTFTQTAHGM
jgi:hypothetical protein